MQVKDNLEFWRVIFESNGLKISRSDATNRSKFSGSDMQLCWSNFKMIDVIIIVGLEHSGLSGD